MPKKVLFLYFISCFPFNSFAQKASDKQAILSILDQQTKQWNTGNTTAFMEGYWKSDSLLFIGKSGITNGWQKTLDNYKKGYPDASSMGTLNFGVLKIDFLSKKSCWVLGKWHLTRPEKGDIGGHFTLIFKKINGQWFIVSDHSS